LAQLLIEPDAGAGAVHTITMFFLLVPALTSLISLPMSWWIQDLHFFAGPAFFAGLSAIAVSLLLFSLKSWR
jgi:hypothetical protein